MDVTIPPAEDHQPTLALPTGEQCAACGAPLARDQRYCVACGERRGKPRLPFMDGRQRQVSPAPAAAAAPPARRRPGASAGTTLVAGVGTLVLAMGVGVLIGRSGGNGGGGRAAAPAVQVVTVAGAGGGSTDTTATTAARGSKASKGKVKALPRSKLPPPTVTLGQRGSGPGFRRGRFTGDFFGQ